MSDRKNENSDASKNLHAQNVKSDAAENEKTQKNRKKEKAISNENLFTSEKSNELDENNDKVSKDGRILSIKTDEIYDTLWKAFLEFEEPDFYEKMGYGKFVIERIGQKKFIDIMDWTKIEDTKKWRTDMLHILPCCHCENEFAIYEMEFCLCVPCQKLFYMDKLEKIMDNFANNRIMALNMRDFDFRAKFVFNKTLRQIFLKNDKIPFDMEFIKKELLKIL